MTVLIYLKKYCGLCLFCGGRDTLQDADWSRSNLSQIARSTKAKYGRQTSLQPPHQRTRSNSIDITNDIDEDDIILEGSFCDLFAGGGPYVARSSGTLPSRMSNPCFSPACFSPEPPILMRVPSVTDVENTMPDMNQNSSIVTPYQISALYLNFPPRLRLYPWTLMYSLKKDGCSLQNLYSKLESYEHTLLMLILDTKKTIFGAVLSAPNVKQKGKSYYGSFETFVFSFYPRLQKYTPSGKNNYFMMCMPDGITIGSMLPAIWLDNNLERGTSNVSCTFDNLPLTDETFVVRDIECWALAEIEYMDELFEMNGLTVPDSIYKKFDSALLAEKRPEKEVGGVRCGRCSINYHPTWKPEENTKTNSTRKKMFKLGGDDSEEEEDSFLEDNVLFTPSRCLDPTYTSTMLRQQDNKKCCHKRRAQGGSMLSPMVAAAWSDRYR